MRIKNVFISLAVVGLAGYGALKLYVFYKAEENFQQILVCAGMPRMPKEMPKSNLFEYDRISASVFGPIGIKGLKIRIPQIEEEITFGELLLTYEYDGDLKNCPTPKHINFSINDMTISVSMLEKMEKQAEKNRRKARVESDSVPPMVRRLGYADAYNRGADWRALGYDQIVADISFDLQFNPNDSEATFDVQQKVKDLGNFRFMIKVADMSKNINSAVLGVKIKEAKIEYTDNSYMKRLFKVFADINKQDVDAYRKEVAAGLDADFKTKEIKLNEDAVKSLKSFLENPNKLIVTMYPFRPVGIESIKHYKPGDIPMLLNLQIYTE